MKSRQYYDDLKERVDLRDIAEKLLGQSVFKGSNYSMYRSPLRDNDDTASLAVYANGYKDYGGQGDSGDALQFLQAVAGMSWAESVAHLEQLTAGIAPELRQVAAARQSEKKSSPNEPPPATWQDAAREALAAAQAALWADTQDAALARDYLRGRGLSDDSIKRFGLGYNHDWLKTTWKRDGKPARLAPGIVIPIFGDGALWALKVRKLYRPLSKKQADLRYINLADGTQGGILYNGDAIEAGKPVLFVEGEFDAMLAQQAAGDRVTVVTLTSATNKRIAPRWLKRLKDCRIMLALDNDEAGQGAATELAQQFGSAVMLRYPEGVKDYTEYHQAGHLLADLLSQARQSAKVLQFPDAKAHSHRQNEPEKASEAPAENLFEHQAKKDLNAAGPLWWAGDMPDAWRSAILNYMPATAAPFVEAVHRAAVRGLIDPTGFTLQQFQEAAAAVGYELSYSTISRILKQIESVFFSKSDTTWLETDNAKTMSDSENNSSGRRATVYSLRPLEDVYTEMLRWAWPRIVEHNFPEKRGKNDDKEPVLIKFQDYMFQAVGVDAEMSSAAAEKINELFKLIHARQKARYTRAINKARNEFQVLRQKLLDTTSTPLEAATVRNGQDYQVLLLRAKLKSEPEKNATASEWGDLVGYNRQNLSGLYRKAGVYAQQQYEIVTVNSHEDARNISYELPGKAVAIIEQTADMKKHYVYDKKAGQIIREAVAAGHSVQVRYQIANKLHIIREEPLAPDQPMLATDQSEAEPQQLSFIAESPQEQPAAVADQPDTAATEQPEKPQKPQQQPITSKQREFWGPVNDPQWIWGHIALGLQLCAEWSIPLIDTETGEIIPARTPGQLVAAICGESIEGGTEQLAEAR